MTLLARTLLTVVLMVTASLEGAPVLAQATAPSQSAPARTEPARAGSTPTVCQDRLRKACEGIAIGRYCGMKHGH